MRSHCGVAATGRRELCILTAFDNVHPVSRLHISDTVTTAIALSRRLGTALARGRQKVIQGLFKEGLRDVPPTCFLCLSPLGSAFVLLMLLLLIIMVIVVICKHMEATHHRLWLRVGMGILMSDRVCQSQSWHALRALSGTVESSPGLGTIPQLLGLCRMVNRGISSCSIVIEAALACRFDRQKLASVDVMTEYASAVLCDDQL